MSIGKQLKSLLEENDLTRKEFADKVKISYSAVSKYITDQREPDYETLQKMADFFGVTTDYLLGRTNQKYFSQDETIAFSTTEDLDEEDIKMIRGIIDNVIERMKKDKDKD